MQVLLIHGASIQQPWISLFRRCFPSHPKALQPVASGLCDFEKADGQRGAAAWGLKPLTSGPGTEGCLAAEDGQRFTTRTHHRVPLNKTSGSLLFNEG